MKNVGSSSEEFKAKVLGLMKQFPGLSYHDAQDRVQDAELDLHLSKETVQNTPGWFKTVVRRKVHNHLTTHKKEQSVLDLVQLYDQDRIFAIIEAKEMVRMIFSRLDKRHVNLLILHYLDEISVSEIANLIHCSRATAYRALRDAEEAFRSIGRAIVRSRVLENEVKAAYPAGRYSNVPSAAQRGHEDTPCVRVRNSRPGNQRAAKISPATPASRLSWPSRIPTNSAVSLI